MVLPYSAAVWCCRTVPGHSAGAYCHAVRVDRAGVPGAGVQCYSGGTVVAGVEQQYRTVQWPGTEMPLDIHVFICLQTRVCRHVHGIVHVRVYRHVYGHVQRRVLV